MAKNGTKNKTNHVAKQEHRAHDDKDRTLHNPLQTWWGKAVIWIMIIGMVGGIIFAFFFALLSGTA